MKKDYVSVLNVLACFAVVMLHSNSIFWTYNETSVWTSANIIESVMYFGVPIFFMISGVTLMDYRDRYSTAIYLKKRIAKTVIPFLCWNFLRLISLIVTGKINTYESPIKTILEMFVNIEIMPIYWFFIPLFGIYLSIPVLSAIPKDIRKKVLAYSALGAFVLNILVPFICNITGFTYEQKILISILDGYLFYVAAGWLLDQYDLTMRIRSVLYFLSILGLGLHFVGTEILSRNAGEIVSTYKGYLNLPCVFYSIGIFVFIKQCFSKEKIAGRLQIFNKIISKVEGYTFSIYLLHLYVLWGLNGILNTDSNSILYRIELPFFIIPICMLIIWIMRKIPVVKYIVP